MGTKAKGLVTLAEQSGWIKTGRYDEVERLCRAFQRAFPRCVRVLEFGRSVEGRPLVALVVSAPGAGKPGKKPVVLLQGGIHPGEIDGKDAGFWLLRDLLNEGSPFLNELTLLFLPVLNVDGHERVSPNNRPNQIGPAEMGFRANAQNLNLNRDYVKADAPEMVALLNLMNEWDPIVYADFHVSDGAHYEHDIAFILSPTRVGPEKMRASAGALLSHLLTTMSEKGHLPLDFYPVFVKENDPESGFKYDVMWPRFSNDYWGERNRIGVLVETHSWKDYATRVLGTYRCMRAILEKTAAEGRKWKRLADEADKADKDLGGKKVVLTYAMEDEGRTIDFRGVAYRREPSQISGQQKIVYDPKTPQRWRVPLYDRFRPDLEVSVPKRGYYVPTAHAAWVADKLRIHDIQFRVEKRSRHEAVEVFRSREFEFDKRPFEGRTALKVGGEWSREKREIPAGSLFVPVAQKRSRILLHLFEPLAPDSLLAWGFFNAHFERKEYMEDYVAEDVGRDMLLADEKLLAEFRKRLASPEFANNPKERLDFFFRKHPSFDERFALYPIYRA